MPSFEPASAAPGAGLVLLLCLWGAIPWFIWFRVRERHPAAFHYFDSEFGPLEIRHHYGHPSRSPLHYCLRLSLRAHQYIWALRFQGLGDSWLSGLCWAQIALDIGGVLLATWHALPQLRLFLD
jgi:hypothetical protein